MPAELTPIEARILGSLVEKSLTTPDQYPLTFNALINACNQKTSRDPVMSIGVEEAGKAVQKLIDKDLAERLQIPGDRVPKFKHYVRNLIRSDDPKVVGTVCVLLLRGPQTSGEIKSRTDRLCAFTGTAEVEGLLQDLAGRADGPLVFRLSRKPGQKEARYRHLFYPLSPDEPPEPPSAALKAAPDRLAELEKKVSALEGVLRELAEKLR